MAGVTAWLDVLGCPYCRGPLRADDDSLFCPACDQRFPIRNQIPSLVRRDDAAALADFGRRYREARLQEGWRPLTSEQALALPYGSPPGYPPLYWQVRRQSYEALMDLLSDQGPAPEGGPVADLGAGSGWLAHRLAREGYRVAALEASLQRNFGLRAASVYLTAPSPPFLPIQGDLDHPPLQQEKLSLAVLNASLHYARDLETTLRRTAEALVEGGRLVILDTPIAQRSESPPHPTHARPSNGRPRHSLGRRELERALMAAGLSPRWVPVRRGPRWWVYQARTWLKGEARFSFPMVVADRSR